MKRFWLLLPGLLAGCKDEVVPPPDPLAKVPAPTVVREIPATPLVHDSYIRDGILFLCSWHNGVIIYDVGNGMRGGSPANPVLISSLVTGVNAIATQPSVHNAWWFHNPVTSEKKYVFVGQEGPASIPTQSSGDIHVVDISNIDQPAEVAFYRMSGTPPAGAHNFWMDEQAQILYAAYYNGGVVALDVSGTLTGDLANREIARFKPNSSTNFVWGVQRSGTSIYATDLINGFYQLGFSGNTWSVLAGGGNVNERYSSDLWVRGDRAYTGTWGGNPRAGVFGNAIKTWTLSAGGAPTLADSVILASVSTVSDVKGTDDGKLLVASTEGGGNGGLYVFTLTNPLKPQLVAYARAPQGMHTAKIAVIGGRTYVFAARNAGGGSSSALVIFDITALAP